MSHVFTMKKFFLGTNLKLLSFQFKVVPPSSVPAGPYVQSISLAPRPPEVAVRWGASLPAAGCSLSRGGGRAAVPAEGGERQPGGRTSIPAGKSRVGWGTGTAVPRARTRRAGASCGAGTRAGTALPGEPIAAPPPPHDATLLQFLLTRQPENPV